MATGRLALAVSALVAALATGMMQAGAAGLNLAHVYDQSGLPRAATAIKAPLGAGPHFSGSETSSRRLEPAPPPVAYSFRSTAPSCAYEYQRWKATNLRYWRDRFFDCRDS
jgi:hypothetical protein